MEAALPVFNWDEIDGDYQGEMWRPRRTTSTGGKVCVISSVYWRSTGEHVILKEVRLPPEDSCSCLPTCARAVDRIERAKKTHPCSGGRRLLAHLALHIDSPRSFQWLTELCSHSLREVFSQSWSEASVMELTYQLIQALDFLHSHARCVHGDLSPSNILLKYHSDPIDIRVADFESAIPIGETWEVFRGSYWYAAPEMLDGTPVTATPAADVWSLGIIVYQLLSPSRAHPLVPTSDPTNIWEFLDAVKATRLRHTQGEPSRLREASLEAEDCINRCLEWNPSKRMSAADLLQLPWFATRHR